MENTVNVILEKKLDGYSSKVEDFVAPGELTVTITLSEYRQLVATAAEKNYEVNRAITARLEAEEKVKRLEQEIKSLREIITSTSNKQEELK
jgi:hypothetical protein